MPSTEQAADDDRLADRRQDDVLPRRRGVHRRRGGAVAARRAEADHSVGRRRALAASVPDADGVYSCRRSSGSARRTGIPYARGLDLGLTRGTTAATSRGRRSRRWRIRRATCSSRCSASAGLQLAELKVDGGAAVEQRADAVPGRPARRARAAAGRDGNDGARRGVSGGSGRRLLGRAPTTWRRTGRSIASSRRRWTPQRATGCIADGRRPCTRSLDWADR